MHLLRNYFGARPNTALVGAFREQDQDRSGRFSVLEFKAALRALNVDVTEGEAEDVFRHLDADGSGVLELSEFVNAMKAEAPPERRAGCASASGTTTWRRTPSRRRSRPCRPTPRA